jgi:hypothetical protein
MLLSMCLSLFLFDTWLCGSLTVRLLLAYVLPVHNMGIKSCRRHSGALCLQLRATHCKFSTLAGAFFPGQVVAWHTQCACETGQMLHIATRQHPNAGFIIMVRALCIQEIHRYFCLTGGYAAICIEYRSTLVKADVWCNVQAYEEVGTRLKVELARLM